MEKRYPIPPFIEETARQKYNWQKMPGTARSLSVYQKPIARIANGVTGTVSLRGGRKL